MTEKKVYMLKDRWSSLIKNSLKIVWILFVLISIIVWLPQTDHLLSQNFSQISKHISLDDNWDIIINDMVYHNISLEDFSFKTVNKGDKITMQRTLPEHWDIVEGALRFHIRQSAVKMYIDDEQIYEYGYDRVMKNKTVGSGFQFINFPNQYEGKDIKIELYVSENNAFTKFDSIQIYEWENAYRALLTENRLPMFLGSFLVIFGLSTIMVTMFAVVFSRKYVRLFCISAFSICVGLWTLCYYNVVLAYSIPLYSVSLIEYMALYLSPLPLIIYMYENVKNLKNKVLKAVYWTLLAIQVVFDLVILTLHTVDIIHCAAVLKYMQFIIICHLIYFTVVLLINLKNSHPVNRLYLIGMLIIIGCIGYDMMSYYSNRYFGYSYLKLKGVSAIGVMAFIFILIVTFYMNLTEKLMKETERNFLIKSAYTDELTQLYNRRFCSERMKEINEQQDSDCTIISFDLNNLKMMNDTYGHAKGDILIKSAAKVIAETFENHGIVGRMGGDEFIAILPISHEKEIEELINEFSANICKKNHREKGLTLSISYGYALSCELQEKNIEKLYQLADDRMYENKKEYKKHIGSA